MGRVTIRGLDGPHVIVGSHGEEIVTLQNKPVISLPDGKHELSIYKCKGRQFNRKTNKDIYSKGAILTKVTVIVPDEDTIYV